MSAATAIETDEIAGQMREMGQRARAALHDLGSAGTERKNTALRGAAMALRDNIGDLLSSNEKDVTAAEEHNISGSLLDRLKLDVGRIETMASGLEQIADLPDPVGEVTSEWDRPNGLNITRVRVPLGVIGIIYES
ncbi:MAG: gamma-glutamyl-phosphate reductase, partial [Pseudomonadota bacterium]|nr:gamma-glutamyl-phosphate reductase [Pseudomonadota bacterium]